MEVEKIIAIIATIGGLGVFGWLYRVTRAVELVKQAEQQREKDAQDNNKAIEDCKNNISALRKDFSEALKSEDEKVNMFSREFANRHKELERVFMKDARTFSEVVSKLEKSLVQIDVTLKNLNASFIELKSEVRELQRGKQKW